MYEKIVEIGLLFDHYGKLLSSRQYSAIELHYIHDLSLSEVGEHLGISRQGVHDVLKRAESRLYKYEETLGLVKKITDNKEKLKEILAYVDDICEINYKEESNNIYENCRKIKSILLDILESDQEVK